MQSSNQELVNKGRMMVAQTIEVSLLIKNLVNEIKEFNKNTENKIECLFAEYESDTLLATLSKTEDIDLIITEDSDLMVIKYYIYNRLINVIKFFTSIVLQAMMI
jgi:hypothetical protein